MTEMRIEPSPPSTTTHRGEWCVLVQKSAYVICALVVPLLMTIQTLGIVYHEGQRAACTQYVPAGSALQEQCLSHIQKKTRSAYLCAGWVGAIALTGIVRPNTLRGRILVLPLGCLLGVQPLLMAQGISFLIY